MTIETIIEKVTALAEPNGFTLVAHTPKSYVIGFKNPQKVRINVYYSNAALAAKNPTFTLQTALQHPRSGPTQLNRRNVDFKTMKAIFKNPRQHTGKGYFEKVG